MKINRTFISKLKKHDKPKTYWDSELKGFGLRVQTASMSWVIMYRNAKGRQRMLTVGKTDKLTPDEARKLAKDKLAEATKGHDPASDKIEQRNAMKVSELCDLYIEQGCHTKKQSTIKMDISRIERHIKPLIGNLAVNNLTTATIEKMMYDIAQGKTSTKKTASDKKRGYIKITGGKGVATRTVGMFGSILEFAKRHRIIESNPARGIKKYKDKKKEVFLDIEEIKQLGLAIKQAEKKGLNKTALNAIKLLLLTGCRKTEILSLKWDYIDFKNKCFRFPDTKTGKQTRAFGQGALNLLQEIKQSSKNNLWVFPATRGEKHFIGLAKVLNKIKSFENTDTNEHYINQETTLHTLRHSFTSVGADMGFTELTLAGLIGHKLKGITNRYSHNVDSSLISAGDKISLRIETALNGKAENENNVVELKRG
jgi:integrase